jgi:hypothetical protein
MQSEHRLIRYYGDPARMTVCYGLHKIGNQVPYFSVTAEIWAVTGGRQKGRDCLSCGCMHGEIEKHFPGRFSDLIALHLSSQDGIPSHAEANGWYWLAGVLGGMGEQFHGGNSNPPRTRTACLRILSDHLRLSIEQAQRIADCALESGNAREWFKAFVEEQKPRWRQEARDAIARHNLQAEVVK